MAKSQLDNALNAITEYDKGLNDTYKDEYERGNNVEEK